MTTIILEMDICVRFGFQSALIGISSNLVTIDGFKEHIKEIFELDPEFQVIHDGMVLQDGYTFLDYQIKPNDVIYLVDKNSDGQEFEGRCDDAKDDITENASKEEEEEKKPDGAGPSDFNLQ